MGGCGKSVPLHDVSSYQVTVPRSCKPEARRPLPPTPSEGRWAHKTPKSLYIFASVTWFGGENPGEGLCDWLALGRPCLGPCRETLAPWYLQHGPARVLGASSNQGLYKMGQRAPLGRDGVLPEGASQGQNWEQGQSCKAQMPTQVGRARVMTSCPQYSRLHLDTVNVHHQEEG